MPKGKSKGKSRALSTSAGRGFSFRTTLAYVAGAYQVANGVIAGIWSMGFSSIAAQSIAFAQLGDAYRFFKLHRVSLEAMPAYISAATDLSHVGVTGVLGWVPEGSTAPNDVTDFETTAMSQLTQVGGYFSTIGAAQPNPIHLTLGAEHFLGQTGGWFVTHSDATDPFLDTVGQVYLVLSDVTSDTAFFYLRAVIDCEFKEPLDPASISLAAERRLLSRPDALDHLVRWLQDVPAEKKAAVLTRLLPSFK